MKVAIVHDDLMRRGGAEQVALALHQLFPEAPLYTLCYQPHLTYPQFSKAKVKTSWFQLVAKNEFLMKMLFFPLGYLAMRMLKIRGYDIVILSSTYASKYASFDKKSIIINYCHNPFRLAWYPHSYDIFNKSKGLKKAVLNYVVRVLRIIDLKHAQKCHLTIANSRLVKERIKEKYGIEVSKIINPPVNLENFKTNLNLAREKYLVVSRLESYKLVDLVISAFNSNGMPLTVVGNGSMRDQLRKMASSNILFKENISTEELLEEYASAKALIFPQLEDFGITPLEANAVGTPVIAYGKGGVLETIIPNPETNSTGLFFYEQSAESLNEAIQEFELIKEQFKTSVMKSNAERFSINNFHRSLLSFIDSISK